MVGPILERHTYVSDVHKLIDTTIKNNKSGRKTTIIYQKVKYTSPDELQKLLDKLNINKTYSWDINYDINFIESIELYTHIPYLKSIVYDLFQDTLGGKETGSRIKQLILLARENYISKSQYYFEDIKIKVQYTSKTGNDTIIDLDTDNIEDISNLRKEIRDQKEYKIGFNIEQSNSRVLFIITVSTDIPELNDIKHDLFFDASTDYSVPSSFSFRDVGSEIKKLILLARENYISKSQTYFEDIKIQVDYISETGNEIIINLDTDNAEDISNFKEEIKNQKKYMMYTAKDQSNPRNKFIIKIRPDE